MVFGTDTCEDIYFWQGDKIYYSIMANGNKFSINDLVRITTNRIIYGYIKFIEGYSLTIYSLDNKTEIIWFWDIENIEYL